MTRAIAMFVAVTFLVGCKGSPSLPPAVDPFTRTTVEPPATGAIGAQPPGRAFYANPPQTGAPPAGTTGAGPVSPTTGQKYAPPDGSFQFNGESNADSRPLAATRPGDHVAIPADARDLSKQPAALAGGPVEDRWASRSQANAAGFAAKASGSEIELAGGATEARAAGRERFVRTIAPRPDAATSGQDQATGNSEPAKLPSSDKVIDIMDLPAAGASNSRQAANGVVLASATEVVQGGPASDATAGKTDSFSQQARYGHAADYSWLRGRLEYSQIDRRWKLRYIPIDGKTDDYGGSVLITNPTALSGYERGNYVEVHGQLDTSMVNEQHFTPQFKIAQIQSVAN